MSIQSNLLTTTLLLACSCLYGQNYIFFKRCDCEVVVVENLKLTDPTVSHTKKACYAPILTDIEADLSSLNNFVAIDFSVENDYLGDTLYFGGLTHIRCLMLPRIDSIHLFSLHQFKGIETLSQLKCLGISGIGFKTIPFDFSQLVSLQALDLSFADDLVLDSVRVQLVQLQELRILYLHGSAFDQIPDWLYDIRRTNKKLRRVVLNDDLIPAEELKKFRKATRLNTSYPTSDMESSWRSRLRSKIWFRLKSKAEREAIKKEWGS